jgi:hypothetical protein
MKLFICLCAGLCLRFAASAAAPIPSSETARVQRFVQEFYDWYAPIALKEHSGPSSDIAIQSKGFDFTPELAKALKEDSNAQKKVQGDVVGLDFDPFLNSQDPEDRYVVTKVTPRGQGFWVEVHGVVHDKMDTKPSVFAEVVKMRGIYRFENFQYPPGGQNLLSVLKSLRKERDHGGEHLLVQV